MIKEQLYNTIKTWYLLNNVNEEYNLLKNNGIKLLATTTSKRSAIIKLNNVKYNINIDLYKYKDNKLIKLNDIKISMEVIKWYN